MIDEFSEPRLVAVYETINDYELGTQPDFCRELATDIDAKTIVDIGCGTGLITRELARLGYRMIGVDPEAARIDTKTVFLGIDDDIVWFKNDSFFAGTGELVVSQAKLRFRTLDELTGTLADAGFAIDRPLRRLGPPALAHDLTRTDRRRRPRLINRACGRPARASGESSPRRGTPAPGRGTPRAAWAPPSAR